MTDTSQAAFAGNVVALDFDGVLHSYRSGWTGWVPTDPPEDGAHEFVEWLIEQGAEVVVVTARALTSEGTEATQEWLRRHGFPQLRVTNEKVRAAAYIDDRAIPYRSGSWARCQSEVARLVDVLGPAQGTAPSS